QDGRYSCWRRDEFTLDLWVRLPECSVDAVAARDPSTRTAKPPTGLQECVGSPVSIKVQNAVTDLRGKPDRDSPGLVGETPEPTPADDPLLGTPPPTA